MTLKRSMKIFLCGRGFPLMIMQPLNLSIMIGRLMNNLGPKKI